MKPLLLSCSILLYLIERTLALRCFHAICYVDGILGCKNLIWDNVNTAEECCMQGSAVGFAETIKRLGSDPGCYECDRCVDVDLWMPKINGEWSEWSEWGPCSKTCNGIGVKTRHRRWLCDSPSDLGNKCDGEEVQQHSCISGPCPVVDGQWSNWSSWSHCSKSCGIGKMYRTRDCNNPAPAHGGRVCQGLATLVQECVKIENCPIDGGWGEWGAWTKCSKSCGGGESHQYRSCDNPLPQFEGKNCNGESRKSDSCNNNACPIDGQWSDWSSWSYCSKSCGIGKMYRNRDCNNPKPAHGGRVCQGLATLVQECVKIVNCPIDGQWSDWSSWTDCSKSCGVGKMYRTRDCNNPKPAHGGRVCQGLATLVKECVKIANCPIDGGWGEWTPWTKCSKSCGGGESHKYRSCDNPLPQFEGKNCTGESRKSDICNDNACPVDGQWSEWSPHSACIFDDCNDLSKGGHQTRSRTCNSPSPKFGGKMCTGKIFDVAFCIEDDNCPRDGEWSEWDHWQCSETGVYRVRECLHWRFDGKYCPGNYIMNKPMSDPTFCDDCKSNCRLDDSGKLMAHYLYHRQLQNAWPGSDTGDGGSRAHSVEETEEDEFPINIKFDNDKCRYLI